MAKLTFLQNLGLSETESSLYELLLRLGEVPASDIIRETGLKRPTVYKALYSLEKKGLVSQQDIKKKIHFRPASPTLLMEQAESRYMEASQARNMLQIVMPNLLSSYTLSVERPVVQVYEGVEGVKKVYLDTLETGQPMFSFIKPSEAHPEIFSWLNNEYVKKRAKAKLHAKVIAASGEWTKEYAKRSIDEYRTIKQIDKDMYPFQHEVIIYGDKVAFVSFQKSDKLIGIIISNARIAMTMKAIFDLSWLQIGDH